MARKLGKNIKKARALVEARLYKLGEAAEVVKKAHYVKFDETVELVVNLGIDPKHSDQMVRGTVVLPHGLGQDQARPGNRHRRKSPRGAGRRRGFCRRRGYGPENSGRMDRFRRGDRHAGHDALRRTFGQSARPARLDAQSQDRDGHFRSRQRRKGNQGRQSGISRRQAGIIHSPIGKVSFDAVKLADNAHALIGAILKAKPAAAKGKYVKKVTLTSTMGPGVLIDPAEVEEAIAAAA